jgi:hypothetical protein
MTHPTPHNSTILSLIKGIRILSFNGKEITPKKTMADILDAQSKRNVLRPAEKKGRAKP